MLGFVELNLHEHLRERGAVPYARRKRDGHFLLEISTPAGVYILQRQRGGAREFKTFEALLKLLEGHRVVEFAVVLDDAKVRSGERISPWGPPLKHDVSLAFWRHDFDLPF